MAVSGFFSLTHGAMRLRDPRTAPNAWDTSRMTSIRDELGEAGRRSYDCALRSVGSDELYLHAVERYARAVDFAERVRAEWVDYGKPYLYDHVNGAKVIHPLVKLLRDAERDAAVYARDVLLDPSAATKRKPGRPMGSAHAPDRKAPPLVKLSRSVSRA